MPATSAASRCFSAASALLTTSSKRRAGAKSSRTNPRGPVARLFEKNGGPDNRSNARRSPRNASPPCRRLDVFERTFVAPNVALDHRVDRKAVDNRVANHLRPQLVRQTGRVDHFVNRRHEIAVLSVADKLARRSFVKRYDGSSARHRLDYGETERFGDLNRMKKRFRTLQKPNLLCLRQLTDVRNEAAVYMRLYEVMKI